MDHGGGGTARLSLLPDVPTVAESGFPGFDAVGWGSSFVPNDTPQPIIDKLAATIASVVTLQEVKTQSAAQGTEPASSTQGEMAKMVQDDYARFGELANGSASVWIETHGAFARNSHRSIHLRSPDGAKGHRGTPVPRARPVPDAASLHPGYNAARQPIGRSRQMRHLSTKATALALAGLAATATLARAQQDYPTKPIHFIATEVVGSATDIQARIIAKGMAPLLGQPIEIENIFGEPGLQKAIKSAPDGYTIVYGGAGTLAILPHIKKVSFDPLHDLTPVGRFAISPTLLAVNPSLPVHNVEELVALMKANPGKLKMSTAGAGTAGHFAGEIFIAMAGVKPVVVHYPGGGPAIEAVVNNDSQWTMAPIAGRLPHVRSGELRALATGGTTRLPALPDVPTIAESGYPGYNSVGWAGIYVPNGVPQLIIDKLNAAIVKAVTLPEVKKEFAQQGVEGASSTQAEVTQMLQEDYVHIGELARSIGVGVE